MLAVIDLAATVDFARHPVPGTASPSVPGWLADPALSRLWAAVRARLERSHLVPAGRIVLTGLQRLERHAIGDLLAPPIVADRVTIDPAQLDQVLARRSPYRGLAATVAAVTGRQLEDRRAQRSAAAAAREEPLGPVARAACDRGCMRRHHLGVRSG